MAKERTQQNPSRREGPPPQKRPLRESPQRQNPERKQENWERKGGLRPPKG